MLSNKPQTATVERPSPRARATGLRAEAARVMQAPVAPELATLIAEHDAFYAAANAPGLSDETAEALIYQCETRFRQACAVPARNPADFLAKLRMMMPDLRRQIAEEATSLHAAVNGIEVDAAILWERSPPSRDSSAHDSARETGTTPDLSGLTLRQLGTLLETMTSAGRTTTRAGKSSTANATAWPGYKRLSSRRQSADPPTRAGAVMIGS